MLLRDSKHAKREHQNPMTNEQQKATERLQATQPEEPPKDRFQFMRAIVSVPKEELETAPEPPKEKRGRKPSPPKSSA